jgi:hypothetical protein
MASSKRVAESAAVSGSGRSTRNRPAADETSAGGSPLPGISSTGVGAVLPASMLATAVRQPSQPQQQLDQSTSCKQVTVLQRACDGRQEAPAVFPASTLATALGQPSQPQQLLEHPSSCLQVTVLQRATEGRQEAPAGVVPIAGVSSALNNKRFALDAEVVDKFDNPLHSHSCFRIRDATGSILVLYPTAARLIAESVRPLLPGKVFVCLSIFFI